MTEVQSGEQETEIKEAIRRGMQRTARGKVGKEEVQCQRGKEKQDSWDVQTKVVALLAPLS